MRCSRILSLLGAGVLLATPARARTESPRPAETPQPQANSSLAAPAEGENDLPGREAAAEPEAAPDEESSLGGLGIRVKATGKIKPTIIVGNGIESYERPNAVAPTAAVNPVFSEAPDRFGTSFQAQQTRLGLVVGMGTVTGKVEVDFVDFNQASPTTTVRPRLRIAEIGWKLTPRTTLELGQTWDLVSPLVPHGYNLVGAFFRSGNSAFMRHQIRIRQEVGDVEVALGIASAAPSSATPWGNTELGQFPAGVLRLDYRPVENLRLGVSGLVVRLRFAPEVFENSYHGSVHAQYKTKSIDLRAEGYVSHDGANTGLLNLSQGYYDETRNRVVSINDAGGFLSLRGFVSERVSLYASVGVAAVLNPSDVRTAVVRDADGVPSRRGIGIELNGQARVGGTFDINDLAFLYAEPYSYLTHHQLVGRDAAEFEAQRTAWGLEAGGLLHF